MPGQARAPFSRAHARPHVGQAGCGIGGTHLHRDVLPRPSMLVTWVRAWPVSMEEGKSSIGDSQQGTEAEDAGQGHTGRRAIGSGGESGHGVGLDSDTLAVETVRLNAGALPGVGWCCPC